MIAILLAAQIVSHAPPLTPAEAARILAASPGLSNWANHPDPLPPGPTVTIIYSSPTAGPFGEFEPQSESRRLDGTLLSRPVDWYSPVLYPWQPFHTAAVPRFRHRIARQSSGPVTTSFRHGPVVGRATARPARR